MADLKLGPVMRLVSEDECQMCSVGAIRYDGRTMLLCPDCADIMVRTGATGRLKG